MPGAVRILTAADIPSAGKNSFTNWKGLKPEEVHVGGTCVSNIHCCIGAGTRCITVCWASCSLGAGRYSAKC